MQMWLNDAARVWWICTLSGLTGQHLLVFDNKVCCILSKVRNSSYNNDGAELMWSSFTAFQLVIFLRFTPNISCMHCFFKGCPFFKVVLIPIPWSEILLSFWPNFELGNHLSAHWASTTDVYTIFDNLSCLVAEFVPTFTKILVNLVWAKPCRIQFSSLSLFVSGVLSRTSAPTGSIDGVC